MLLSLNCIKQHSPETERSSGLKSYLPTTIVCWEFGPVWTTELKAMRSWKVKRKNKKFLVSLSVQNLPLTLECNSLLESNSTGGIIGFHTYWVSMPARMPVCTFVSPAVICAGTSVQVGPKNSLNVSVPRGNAPGSQSRHGSGCSLSRVGPQWRPVSTPTGTGL